MDLNTVLHDIGLTQDEGSVYLALSRLGSCPVNQLKEEVDLHRTTIYDVLVRLYRKGFVSYTVKDKVRYYNAAKPEKIIYLMKEKQRLLKKALPKLKDISEKQKEIKLELYSWKGGFKSILNEMLKAKIVYGFDIDEKKIWTEFPNLMGSYYKHIKKKNIKHLFLVKEGTKSFYGRMCIRYRFMPKIFFNPIPCFVYGDVVAYIMWNPPVLIRIENRQFAKSFKNYFKLTWDVAKK